MSLVQMDRSTRPPFQKTPRKAAGALRGHRSEQAASAVVRELGRSGHRPICCWYSALASYSQSRTQGFHYFFEHRDFQRLDHLIHIGRRKMVICRIIVVLSDI